MKINVVIMAAGKGTRMRSQRAKVLQVLAGEPLLAHVLRTAEGLADTAPVVVVGHDKDRVQACFAHRKIQWAEQNQQLGTGHAVLTALPALEQDAVALILSGDVPMITTKTLNRLMAKASTDGVALLTVVLEDPSGYGRIMRDTAGRVTGIIEEKDASETQKKIREINTGIMAVPVKHLHSWLPKLSNDNAQGEYYLTEIFKLAVRDGVSISTASPDHEWEVLGINDRRQQARLERMLQEQRALTLLEQGVTLSDPQRFDCRGHLICGKDVSIDINCIFNGAVELDDGVSIEANCIISNSRIAAGTLIKANSIVEDSIIGEACTVGPFARVRPGTDLASGAKIGNFVETKNAQIGKGSKVNHLSYVGDAEVGSGVNIGAGTITCNYDGVNKHQTRIGDGAFVGSNSALVAPVSIGANATIGAGSTINKNAPAEKLTLTRAKQQTLEHWQRPTKK